MPTDNKRAPDMDDLVSRKEKDRARAIVTFSCGHTSHFIDSPPKVGNCVICRTCLQEVMVVAATARDKRGLHTKENAEND